MHVNYITVQGSNRLSSTPYYIAFPQHERVIQPREAYEIAAERTGYKATSVRAVFMAINEVIRENQAKGNITYVDGVTSVRNVVKGSFESLAGPWVKGVNYLLSNSVEMDPFKSTLAGVVPTNKTEGAKPTINTVLDEVTREYDIVKLGNLFSIAGSDLGVDVSKSDEYVCIADDTDNETRATVSYSDLGNVKGTLPSGITPGRYTLKVYTRSGLGERFGVAVASRKIEVVA